MNLVSLVYFLTNMTQNMDNIFLLWLGTAFKKKLKIQKIFFYISENYPMAQRRSYVTSVKRKGGEDVDHVFLRFGKRG